LATLSHKIGDGFLGDNRSNGQKGSVADFPSASSSRVEHVNAILHKVLPEIEQDVLAGAIVSVEDQGIRRRPLPVN
jgi:hypothetical protein